MKDKNVILKRSATFSMKHCVTDGVYEKRAGAWVEDGEWIIENAPCGIVLVLKNCTEQEARKVRDCLGKAYRAGRADKSAEIRAVINAD